MNNERELIEKLIYEHTGFNPNVADDGETIKHIKNLLEAFAKALQQSSEPVAWRYRYHPKGKFEYFETKKEFKDMQHVGSFYLNFLMEPLFTHPPASVPLEKYNRIESALVKAIGILEHEGVYLKVVDSLRQAIAEAELSAYKPQADDVPPDVYDIVVDTGDGIYHTAEVVHFQQTGSKRMIQVRLGDQKADDVWKDAERWRTFREIASEEMCYALCGNSNADNDELDQAIDKARE